MAEVDMHKKTFFFYKRKREHVFPLHTESRHLYGIHYMEETQVNNPKVHENKDNFLFQIHDYSSDTDKRQREHALPLKRPYYALWGFPFPLVCYLGFCVHVNGLQR